MSFIRAFRDGDQVPDSATFLCVHTVRERVRAPYGGASTINLDTGKREPAEAWTTIESDVPYAWFLVPA